MIDPVIREVIRALDETEMSVNIDPEFDGANLNMMFGSIPFHEQKPLLLSGGGFDSLAVAQVYKDLRYSLSKETIPIPVLFIDFGQKSEPNESIVAIEQADHFGRGQIFFRDDPTYSRLLRATNSGLATGSTYDNPVGTTAPGRNFRLLSTAHLVARQEGFNTILFGGQGSVPDTTPKFLDSVQRGMEAGDQEAINIFAPFSGVCKHIILLYLARKSSLQLSQLAFSCTNDESEIKAKKEFGNYSVSRHPLQCGHCRNCRILKYSLNLAGLPQDTLNFQVTEYLTP